MYSPLRTELQVFSGLKAGRVSDAFHLNGIKSSSLFTRLLTNYVCIEIQRDLR